jgi:hypothetical protein
MAVRFGFWTLIVLAYSTRGEIRVGPYHWVSLSWLDAFKAAAAHWYAWGLMSVAIYWVNRRLPVASDALVKRMLLHVPLSILFTVAYTYITQVATVLLGAPEAAPWLGGSRRFEAAPVSLERHPTAPAARPAPFRQDSSLGGGQHLADRRTALAVTRRLRADSQERHRTDPEPRLSLAD